MEKCLFFLFKANLFSYYQTPAAKLWNPSSAVITRYHRWWPVTKVDDSPNSITLHRRNFLNFLIFEERIVECVDMIKLPSRNIVVFPLILKLCWVTAHLYPGIMDITTSSETKPTIFRWFSESKCSVQLVSSKWIKLSCLWISVPPGKMAKWY